MYFSATINYDGGNLRVSKKQWRVRKAVGKTVESAKRQWRGERGEKQWRVRKAVGKTVERGEWRGGKAVESG